MKYIIASLIILFTTSAIAQSDRKSEKLVKKLARKEMKSLAKQGWYSALGAIPLQAQLEKYYRLSLKEDANGYSVYIGAISFGRAKTNTIAQIMALEQNKIIISERIRNDIFSRMEANIGFEEISNSDLEEIKSITTNMIVDKMAIEQKLAIYLLRKTEDAIESKVYSLYANNYDEIFEDTKAIIENYHLEYVDNVFIITEPENTNRYLIKIDIWNKNKLSSLNDSSLIKYLESNSKHKVSNNNEPIRIVARRYMLVVIFKNNIEKREFTILPDRDNKIVITFTEHNE